MPGNFIEDIISGEAFGESFAFSLPDPLPAYVTDERPPTLEDNMWLLQQIADGEAFDSDLSSLRYKAYFMDGPFRMTVYYYDVDRYAYSFSSFKYPLPTSLFFLFYNQRMCLDFLILPHSLFHFRFHFLLFFFWYLNFPNGYSSISRK